MRTMTACALTVRCLRWGMLAVLLAAATGPLAPRKAFGEPSGDVRQPTAEAVAVQPRRFATLCFEADVAPQFFCEGEKTQYFDAMRKLPEAQRAIVMRLYYDGVYVTFDITSTTAPPRVVYIEVMSNLSAKDLWADNPLSPVAYPAGTGSSSALDERNLWRVNLLPDLEYLNLLPSDLSSTALLALDSRTIRSLCLPAFIKMSNKDVASLVERESVPELRHLDLPTMGNALTPDVLRVVSGFTDVREGWAGTAEWRTCGLAHLESVHLLGPRVTDEWLGWLKQDVDLHVSHPEKVAGRKNNTPAAHRLKGLGLRGTLVSDAGLDNLSVCVNLTHLAIVDSPRITTEGIKRLKSLPGLEELHLAGAQFTDGVLPILRDMPKLRVLVLDYSSVTDRGMLTVKGLDRLAFVSVVGTKVTAQAAQEWKQERPQIRNVRLVRAKEVARVQGWIQGIYGLWDDGLFRFGM